MAKKRVKTLYKGPKKHVTISGKKYTSRKVLERHPSGKTFKGTQYKRRR